MLYVMEALFTDSRYSSPFRFWVSVVRCAIATRRAIALIIRAIQGNPKPMQYIRNSGQWREITLESAEGEETKAEARMAMGAMAMPLKPPQD